MKRGSAPLYGLGKDFTFFTYLFAYLLVRLVGTPSLYETNETGQLSLASLLWVGSLGTVSTGYMWTVSRRHYQTVNTVLFAVSTVVHWYLVSVERTATLRASRLGVFRTVLRGSIRRCSLIVIISSNNNHNNNSSKLQLLLLLLILLLLLKS